MARRSARRAAPRRREVFFGARPMNGQPFRGSDNLRYWHRVKALFGDALIAYWPLADTSGTVATDRSDNGRNGAYTGVALANTAHPSGSMAPLFDAGDYVNVHTALNGVLNGNEGTLIMSVKPLNATFWSDATARVLCRLMVDVNNDIRLYKSGSSKQMMAGYTAGGTAKTFAITSTGTDWQMFSFRWSRSNNRINLRANGSHLFNNYTAGGEFTGALSATDTVLGAFSTAGNLTVGGWMGHAILLNREITDAEDKALWRILYPTAPRMSILGDSISTVASDDVQKYFGQVALSYGASVISRGTSGQTIVSHMAAQATATASDDADIIIIELGTNDDNAGNMTTLQERYEAGIAALKVSNPRATIYGMLPFHRWTAVDGLTEVDKSNIRAAITAACTAQSITCWDTYTVPWITAADTSDGTHPTTAGHTKIATQILSLLP